MEYLTVLSYGTLLLDADMILAPSPVELVLATSCQILEESDASSKTGSNNARPDIMPLYSQLHGSKPWRAKVANNPFLL